MKSLHFHAGMIGAGMLAAAAAFAGPYDGHPDLEQSILNDNLDSPAYVGTSMQDARSRIQVYNVSRTFPNHDMDETGFVDGTSGPERGQGELYGSILIDVGALQ